MVFLDLFRETSLLMFTPSTMRRSSADVTWINVHASSTPVLLGDVTSSSTFFDVCSDDLFDVSLGHCPICVLNQGFMGDQFWLRTISVPLWVGSEVVA
jgi:hypothetical protein